jgi:DNA recombination protein RmuC
MQIVSYILIAALAAALGACIVLLRKRMLVPAAVRDDPAIAEAVNAARQECARLETELAVERERAGRVPALEQTLAARETDLAEAGAARGRAERDLAVATEARTRTETEIATLGERVASLVMQLAASETERVALKVADSEKAVQVNERDGAIAGLKQTLAKAEDALRDMTASHREAATELATLREALDQERRAADDKLKLLTDAQDTLTNQFQVLANNLMTQHGEAFSKQNKEQIEGLLMPLRDRIKDFEQGLQNAHSESLKDRAALGAEIKRLTAVSATMTAETTNLTRALRGKTQTQGAWGEMVLATVLEKSGLREGEEYHTQRTHRDDEGRRLRPDVIVNLPGGDHVVLDSKVSLVAFEVHINAETEEERALALRRHVESVRAHIKKLSGKEYQAISAGGLDYVMMFIPIEGAWAAAVNEDPELTLLAAECNVTIATPTTLMMALRTVHSVWRVERRNANAEAIAERAGKLYAKFVGFLNDFAQIGDRLTQASDSYQGALSKLRGGPGNVIWQIEMLKAMGAKTTKAIPAALLGDRAEGSEASENEEAA